MASGVQDRSGRGRGAAGVRAEPASLTTSRRPEPIGVTAVAAGLVAVLAYAGGRRRYRRRRG
jgi:hypothetical protein